MRKTKDKTEFKNENNSWLMRSQDAARRVQCSISSFLGKAVGGGGVVEEIFGTWQLGYEVMIFQQSDAYTWQSYFLND